MRLHFTKMQGAGNDFVVLDATREPIVLDAAQRRRLADRRLGVGADQVLLVEPADAADADFRYRVFNRSGDEVEHCGNGARCLVRFLHARGLTDARHVRVETVNNRLVLSLDERDEVRVDMGPPRLRPADLPFDDDGLAMTSDGRYLLPLDGVGEVVIDIVSMGNPHAVVEVDDLATAPVATLGPRIERHPRFARGVNVGFARRLGPADVALRVWERHAGETPACGTGACAAVVAMLRRGRLAATDAGGVAVHAPGGLLHVGWPSPDAAVWLSGPAEIVFEGSIELPDDPQPPQETR